MSTDVLLRRARAILAELRMRRPTLLQQWMAHYLAETIERLEGAADDVAAGALADRCAGTITRLWELQVQLQTNAVDRGVNRFIRRAELTEDVAARLHAVLEGPEARDGTLNSEDGVTLWQLTEVEKLVTSVLWGAHVRTRRKAARAAVKDVRAEAHDDAGELLASSAQKELKVIFPALADAALEDEAVIVAEVTSALRRIDHVRRLLLWRDEPLAE